MKIFTALLALACLSPIAARAEGPKEWKEIRVATEGAFRPWNYSNPDGTLGGFEVDLYADLCRRMQAHCTLEATPFDGVIPALLAGKFDARGRTVGAVISGGNVDPAVFGRALA